MLPKKTILFIGGGKEAIPGVKYAKKIGYKTIISDKSNKAPAKKHSDYFIKASTYDQKLTVKKAIIFDKKVTKINGVMSLSADVPVTVASVAKKLKLRSISLKAAKVFSDKYLMKKKFQEYGILVPRFYLIKNFDELKDKISLFKTAIIKPIDSRGARGVYIVGKQNLKKLFNDSMNYSTTKKLILEEFLDGPQLSTETVIVQNKAYTLGVSDRNYEYLKKFKPNVIENGSDMPSKFQKKYLIKINNLMQKIALNLGIKNATLKGDLVIHKNKVFIIEVASRLSGGYFSSHMIPSSTGINLIDIAIKIHVRENILKNDLKVKCNNYISQRYFFSKPGRVKKVIIPKWIRKSKNIVFFEKGFKKNSIVKRLTNHTDRVGQVIVKSKNKSQSINLAKKVCKSIQIKI
tara:strand:- start:518 stop:1732 length:1215 start_codon:yes stop_codon:yes gene_type:complete